jgi:hypothetical protein
LPWRATPEARRGRGNDEQHAAVAINVIGSRGRLRTADSAAAACADRADEPTSVRSTTGFKPCRLIILITSRFEAPSAMRTPISRVRCATSHAITL